MKAGQERPGQTICMKLCGHVREFVRTPACLCTCMLRSGIAAHDSCKAAVCSGCGLPLSSLSLVCLSLSPSLSLQKRYGISCCVSLHFGVSWRQAWDWKELAGRLSGLLKRGAGAQEQVCLFLAKKEPLVFFEFGDHENLQMRDTLPKNRRRPTAWLVLLLKGVWVSLWNGACLHVSHFDTFLEVMTRVYIVRAVKSDAM